MRPRGLLTEVNSCSTGTVLQITPANLPACARQIMLLTGMSLMGTAPLMTKEHPRIDEFLDELAGSQGLNLRTHCGLEAAHFGRCDGRNARPLVKRILSRMGFSAAEIKQSM